jgi:hypothetical protein
MRDPSAEVAERLASGAGDLANGVASMLRALSRATGQGGREEEPSREGDEFWEALRRRASAEARADATAHTGQSTSDGRDGDVADPWRVATTTAPAAPRPMAKKVAKKAVRRPGAAEPAVPPADAAPITHIAPTHTPTPTVAAAEAAAAGGPAVVKKAAPAKKSTSAKKATPAKTAKKAAKKALPPVEEAE